MLISQPTGRSFCRMESEGSHQKLGAGPDRAFPSERGGTWPSAVALPQKLALTQGRRGELFPFCFDHQKFQIGSRDAFFLFCLCSGCCCYFSSRDQKGGGKRERVTQKSCKDFREITEGRFHQCLLQTRSVTDRAVLRAVGVTVHSCIHSSFLARSLLFSCVLPSFLLTYLPTY